MASDRAKVGQFVATGTQLVIPITLGFFAWSGATQFCVSAAVQRKLRAAKARRKQKKVGEMYDYACWTQSRQAREVTG